MSRGASRVSRYRLSVNGVAGSRELGARCPDRRQRGSGELGSTHLGHPSGSAWVRTPGAVALLILSYVTSQSLDFCVDPVTLCPMLLTAVLIPAEEGGFVAFNPETGSTTQGESVPEAIANLREATEIYLEEFPLQSAGQPLVTTFEVAGDRA
jgi:predicted RNase H-like HicB family nuclease